jgi:hypothetical protein
MKTKQLIALLPYNRTDRLFIRAETAPGCYAIIWHGSFNLFRRSDPAIGYRCGAQGRKISDCAVEDAAIDDGDEDIGPDRSSLTVWLRGSRMFLDAEDE